MEDKNKGELKFIPISMIRESHDVKILREVKETDEKFLGLMNSIRQDGIMNPISVREVLNPLNPDVPMYGLVDGRNRFTAARKVGLTEIPAYIRSVADGDLLEAQILANVHKVETKPIEYTTALLNILQNNPTMTREEMARRLSKSVQWLDERLNLVKITNPEISVLVNEGKIKLANAFALAKLPEEKQIEYLDMAQSMTTPEFAPKIHKVIQEIKKAKLEGRPAKTDDYIPTAFLQKMPDIKAEYDSPNAISALVQGITDPVKAAQMALSWVLHLDSMSINEETKKHKENKELQKKKAEERKLEREEAKRKADLEKAQSVLNL